MIKDKRLINSDIEYQYLHPYFCLRNNVDNYGFCFRSISSPEKNCFGRLFLWVADRRGKVRFAPTRYEVGHCEWDTVTGQLVAHPSFSGREQVLVEYNIGMARDLRRVEAIIDNIETKKRYTARGVIRRYLNPTT